MRVDRRVAVADEDREPGPLQRVGVAPVEVALPRLGRPRPQAGADVAAERSRSSRRRRRVDAADVAGRRSEERDAAGGSPGGGGRTGRDGGDDEYGGDSLHASHGTDRCRGLFLGGAGRSIGNDAGVPGELPVTGVRRPLRVGILANEFFDRRLGRMGGFGWAARHAARCFRRLPDEVRPFLVSGEHFGRWRSRTRSHGVPLTLRSRNADVWRRRLESLELDLLLSIDYRPSYDPVFAALRGTPVIVWVRDPRPPGDVAKVQSLRIPGSAAQPLGINPIDCTSMRTVFEQSLADGRPLRFVSPAPRFLEPKAQETYAIPSLELGFLANPMAVVDGGRGEAPARPRVIFLGRLDPNKRPWLFVELARGFPEADFLMLGQRHFQGEGAWSVAAASAPPNLRLLDHLDGAEKLRLLASAAVLVNTSIHEGLPVSFLEALHCGVPLLSCQNPDGVTERFGIDVGRWDGSGMEALPAFEDGLRRLLADEPFRRRLGEAGRAWAQENHTEERFLATFRSLASGLVGETSRDTDRLGSTLTTT